MIHFFIHHLLLLFAFYGFQIWIKDSDSIGEQFSQNLS